MMNFLRNTNSDFDSDNVENEPSFEKLARLLLNQHWGTEKKYSEAENRMILEENNKPSLCYFFVKKIEKKIAKK